MVKRHKYIFIIIAIMIMANAIGCTIRSQVRNQLYQFKSSQINLLEDVDDMDYQLYRANEQHWITLMEQAYLDRHMIQ